MLLNRVHYFFLTVVLCLPVSVHAQSTVFHGSVTDAAGVPLIGATVSVEEFLIGASADFDGNYSFIVPQDSVDGRSVTLRARFIGYRTETRLITLRAGDQVHDFVLVEDLLNLEEVVVTGIASATSKATAEVAVARIDTRAPLKLNSYQDFSQIMSGRTPGVFVQPATGNIGGGIRFNMRSSTGLNGNGQPVIYVDGVRIDQAEVAGIGVGGQGVSMLSMLNPEEIENIEVLKGPAGAASYGTRGSNGVVLITTKKGNLSVDGSVPIRVNYKGVFGSNQQANEYTERSASLPDTVNSFFRDGPIRQHSLAVSGGSRSVRFFTSFDSRNEEAQIEGSYQDRKSFRANFEVLPSESLRLGVNTNYITNDVGRPQGDNSIFGPLSSGSILPVPFPFVDRAAILGLVDEQQVTRFLGSIRVDYSPIRNLSFRASAGLDATDVRNNQTLPANLFYPGVESGSRGVYSRRNEQQTYDLNASYAWTIGRDVTATSIIGTQLFNRTVESTSLTRQNFSTELITNVGAGADLLVGDETFLHSREAGVYLQQEFAFGSKYFATLGLRRDYASAVGAESSSILYPRISGAARLDQITSLPSLITFLKFRAAYGEAGQLPGVLDNSFLRWSAEPSGYGSGAVTSFVGNSTIEPERIKEFEIGIEAELMNNWGLDFTYYRQNATNSIVPFIFVPSSGLSASPAPFNVGEANGSGIEMAISGALLRKRSFGIDFTFIWNHQTNEVTDLGGAQPIFDEFDLNVIKEGLPRSTLYTWSSRATFADDGTYTGAEIMSTDADGDGVPDRVNFGTPYPEDNGSLVINIRAFDHATFGFLADWMLGATLYNGTRGFRALTGGLQTRNEAMVALGLVPPEAFGLEDENIELLDPGTDAYNDAAEHVAGTELFVGPFETRGNFIESADFLKIREISVQYDFSHLLRGVGKGASIRSLSFTLAARNIWTTTKYTGIDPEVNFQGATSATKGWAFLGLAQPRVVYAMISVGL